MTSNSTRNRETRQWGGPGEWRPEMAHSTKSSDKNSKGGSKIGLKKQIKGLYWRMTQAKQKGTKWPGKMEKRHSDQNERRKVQK